MSNQNSFVLDKKHGASEMIDDTLNMPQTEQVNSSKPSPEHQNKGEQFRGAFLGAAIGDALGFITEFMRDSNELQKKYGINRLTELINWTRPTKYQGRYTIHLPLPAGAYSDDTQLTIATARSIQANGRFDADYFAKQELTTWLQYQIGGGSGTKAAAKNLSKKSIDWHNNFYETPYTQYTVSGGNGAAMRVLPIALVHAQHDDVRYTDVWKNAIITHGHPRAIIGALLFADAIATLLQQPSGKKAWLNDLIARCDQKYPELMRLWSQFPEFTAWEKEWHQKTGTPFDSAFRKECGYTVSFLEKARKLADHLHKQTDQKYVSETRREFLQELGCYDRRTKGAGDSTVVAAAFFFMLFSNYEEMITTIVNEFGIDTDTIGYFAGAMFGASYGTDDIPTHFQENIQDQAYLLRLADRCYHIHSEQTVTENSFSHISPEHNGSNTDFSSNGTYEEGATTQLSILGFGKVVKDTNLTPDWTGKHVHFLQVELESGQTVFLQNSQPVSSTKDQQHTPAPDQQGKPVSPQHSAQGKDLSVAELIGVLDDYKDQIVKNNFSPDTILKVLQSIKFHYRDKALYDAFMTWLWGTLPLNASQGRYIAEQKNPYDC